MVLCEGLSGIIWYQQRVTTFLDHRGGVEMNFDTFKKQQHKLKDDF
jgi:hypothetical protein